MKKLLLLASLAPLFSGCNDDGPPAPFSAEMASFSSEFDFDPLRGPVKTFSQTLIDDKGQVVKRISGALSREGCFDRLEFHDLKTDSGAALVLDANYYLDAHTREKRILLQGKCQLAGFPQADIQWQTDDNGFVVSAEGKASRTTYRYDAEGYPLGKSTRAQEDTLAVAATPSADPRKKLDYTAQTTLNNRRIGRASQSCDYDRHDNPVSCRLQILDESVTPPVTRQYSIKNSIDYY